MSHQKKSTSYDINPTSKIIHDLNKTSIRRGEALEAIKSLSDINPYCLEVTLEDTIRLVNTIEQIHKLCKEAEGD